MSSNKSLFANFKEVRFGSVELGTEPELHGKYGTILPFDDDTLTVHVIGARHFKKLALTPGATVYTEGAGEGTIHVPNALLDVAASVIEARKRRMVSEEQRAHLREIGAASRFGKSRR